MNKRRLDFTLIELLVVIAIIAILAAMLLPALNKAREKGYTAKCIGNLKNCNAALAMYATDYNDFYPGYLYYDATYGVSTHVSWGFWAIKLGYLPRTDATVCPSAMPRSDEANNNWQLFTYSTFGYGTSGGIGQISGAVDIKDGSNTYRGLYSKKLKRPSSTVFLFDGLHKGQHSSFPNCKDWQFYSANIRGYAATATVAILAHARHQQRLNAAFLDGHVQGLSGGEYAREIRDMFTGAPALANVQYLDQNANVITAAWPTN